MNKLYLLLLFFLMFSCREKKTRTGYYSDGKIKFIAEVNNMNQKDGIVKEFYSDGKLKRISNYNNGELEGETITFDEDGLIQEKNILYNGYIGYSAFYTNGIKQYETIVPFITSNQDTIELGDLYKFNVHLKFFTYGKLNIFINGVLVNNNKEDSIYLLNQNNNKEFSFICNTTKIGQNKLELEFKQEQDNRDSINADGIIIKHSFYVSGNSILKKSPTYD